jgi:hypothetical protein
MPASDLDNVLYWGELDDTHSRYDRTRVGPSDRGLVIMWSIYSPLLFLFSLVIMVVFLGMITNAKARRNPFNKFIMFLAFLDFVFSFTCAITCLASIRLGRCVSSKSSILRLETAANAWLNGVICWDVYKLLRSSCIRKRYFPPTDKAVYTSETTPRFARIAFSPRRLSARRLGLTQ